MNRTELLKSVGEREFNLNETMSILKRSGAVLMSWGANNFVNYQNKVLAFKVNGHHHKGLVLISLAWNDTYTVTIASTQNNVKKTYNEVYFDMLVDTIDTHIEMVEEYK